MHQYPVQEIIYGFEMGDLVDLQDILHNLPMPWICGEMRTAPLVSSR